jgi:hypothetical protein
VRLLSMTLDGLLDWGSNALLLLVAGGASYTLGLRQARRNALRSQRVQYLVDAYRSIERSSNRSLTPDSSRALEGAFADVFLLGSAAQQTLATEFAMQFARDQSAPMDALLNSLRLDLRKELGVSGGVFATKFLRISDSDS